MKKAFKVCGRYGSYDYGCSTEQYPIQSGVHSNISLELDVLPGEDAGWFGITAAGEYPPALAGLNLSSEYISTKSYNQTSFTTDVQPTRGEWKHIKLDIATLKLKDAAKYSLRLIKSFKYTILLKLLTKLRRRKSRISLKIL